MAKIIMEFDTQEKIMVVTIDGTVLEDANYISASKESYDGETRASISLTIVNKKVDGYRTLTQICASNTNEGRELIQKGAISFKDNLVSLTAISPKVQEDITKFLSRKK